MINSNQWTSGIELKGVLDVHVQTPNRLQATIPKLQYVHVDEQSSQDFEPSQQQIEEYHDVPISKKPFEIILKHGVIRDIKVEKDVPIWEVNLLKSIVGQLQVDTQGENRIKSKSDQIPDNEQLPFASYRVMEDSVSGNCEVHYSITPISRELLDSRPEMVPLPHLDKNFIEIRKTKDYKKCKQQQGYHYSQPEWPITWRNTFKTSSLLNEKPISHVSTNNMVLSGDLKRFTVQSSVTTSNIFVKLGEKDSVIGSVDSKVNLTLVEKNKKNSKLMQQELSTDQFVSTGNLVYMYNNPFSKSAEVRPRYPSVTRNSQQTQSSESSSEEARQSVKSVLQNDQQDGSSSSSSFSSSEEDDFRDATFLQSTPRLNEAPHNPLLPFFIGMKGKNIQTSKEIDVIQQAANLVVQITEGMQDPNVQKPGYTLERFTILQDLLRTMNTDQLTEVENVAFKLSKLKNITKKVKNVLRKTITQIGTGPALEIIKQLIKNRSVKGLEAAMTISRIPKTVRTPTEEYIREFHKLISTPEVTNEDFLNVSAPLALAELIHNVQHDKKYYPVQSFGRMIPPSNVLEELISYFAEQLKEAIHENNSPRVQTYILALCSTGHPKVISVLEPYLEGLQGLTKFQRLMMVNSLSPLAIDHPKLVRPIVFKLYSDSYEPDDIRVAAFYNLIKTNPSLPIMMHIARQTHHDKSKQVNSAVATTIHSLAKLKQWQMQDIATKARMVKKLLNTKYYFVLPRVVGYKNSAGYYADTIHNNFIQRYSLETIAGNRYLPKFAHMKVDVKNSNLGSTSLNVEYALSCIKQLLQYYSQNLLGNKREDQRRTLVEKIAHALNMKSDDVEQFEGYLLTATPYETLLYPFDENVLRNIITNWNNQEHQSNMSFLFNRDKIISFPTESGLPFTYTLNKPILGQIETRNTDAEIKKQSENVKSVFNILFATKSQKRFGFTTPFEHHQYLVGVDRDFSVQLPLEFRGKQQHTKDQTSLEVKLIPQSNEQTLKLIHISTVPFILRHDIQDFQPLLRGDRNIKKVMFANKWQGVPDEVSRHSTSFGAGIFHVVTESEITERKNDNLIKMLTVPHEEEDINYKKLDVLVDNNAANFGIRLNVAHVQSNSDNTANQQPESQTLETFTVTERKPNNEVRRKQFMTELSKSIQPTTNHVWDIDVEYPTLQKQNRLVLTFGLGHNKVDEKYRILLYSNVQSTKDENVDYEVFGTGMMRFSQKTPLNFVNTFNHKPESTLEFLLQHGRNLANEKDEMHVRATMTQSNKLKNMIKNSATVKKCENEIKQGNEGLLACQKATQLAQMLDQIKLSIRADTEQQQKIVDEIFGFLSSMFSGVVQSINRKKNNKDTIDMVARMLPDRDEMDVSVSGSDIELTLSLFGPSEDVHSLSQLSVKSWKLPKLSLQSLSKLPQWLREFIMQLLSQEISQSSLEALRGLISKLSTSTNSSWQIVWELLQLLSTEISKKWSSGLPSQSPRFLSLHKQVESVLQEVELHGTCDIDKNRIVTFDGKLYSPQLTEDWQVVMIPDVQIKPEENTSSADLPKHMKVAVLIREKDDSKQVRLFFNDKEIQLQKINDDMQVLIDKSQVKLYKKQDKPDKRIYQDQDEDGEVYVQIYELPDKSLKLQSVEYGIETVYDGERIQIQVEDRYINALRGLCGTYDSQSDNDFASPQNCIAQRPEDFSAMYTLIEDGQQGYTAKNKNRQYPCKQESYPHSDLRKKSGSSASDIKSWGYHNKDKKYGTDQDLPHKDSLFYHTIVEEDDKQTCFTVRPVPACGQGNQPTEIKPKTYGLYCAPKDEATEQLKNRIKQGANPDLSHKPVSIKKVYEVPLACQAA
ncbi:hypothetical protein ACFW04_002286 [Cataglyphis niger]